MSSTLRFGGVAQVLDSVQTAVCTDMVEYLHARKTAGWIDLSDSEIETIAHKAASVARAKAADGVGEAFHMGKNHSATQADHDRKTIPPPKRE